MSFMELAFVVRRLFGDMRTRIITTIVWKNKFAASHVADEYETDFGVRLV